VDGYAVVAPERGTLMPLPEPRVGANQALVRVVVNGICASDLATWSMPQPQYPIYLGHEPVGEVIEAGPGLSIPVGSVVTGRFGPSLAELVVAAAEDLVVVPDGLEPAHALGEPLGCVVEAFRRTPVRVGDRVAVVGVGFMGLLMLQLLARSPQAALVAIDPRADARAAALHHGADLCLDPSEVPPEFTVGDIEPIRRGVLMWLWRRPERRLLCRWRRRSYDRTACCASWGITRGLVWWTCGCGTSRRSRW
jgi:threonine dehydrogenase-like Zn-dependent dehydrogenase